jgi:hypothetical protein
MIGLVMSVMILSILIQSELKGFGYLLLFLAVVGLFICSPLYFILGVGIIFTGTCLYYAVRA